MNKIIITNNGKVAAKLSGKAEIKFDESKSAIDIFKDTLAVAKEGGKLLIDPCKVPLKNYYRSLPMFMSDEADEKLVAKLESCISEMTANASAYANAPAMAGMAQKKDFNAVDAVVK